MTTSTGAKFGKTEVGTIWLDPDLTSPYRFYQFWMNAEDGDVIRFLKLFTLMDQVQIAEFEGLVESEPHRRAAQKALAEEVTRRVHGESALARALQATDVLFGGSLDGLSAGEIADIFADVPAGDVASSSLDGDGVPLVELLGDSGIMASRGEARRAIEQGGLYLNSLRIEDIQRRVTLEDAIEEKFLVVRRGKKRYHLLRVKG